MSEQNTYQAIVMGTSAGGLVTLKKMLPLFPVGFPIPIIIVQHISPQSDSFFVKMLDDISKIKVKEAVDKEMIAPGTVYFAPPDYHLLVERDHSLSLSMDEKVNYSRPSIDVLFETAAEAYHKKLIGIVLTGANSDGADGLLKIKHFGGYTIVQDPKEAENSIMPEKAIRLSRPDLIASLDNIITFLKTPGLYDSSDEKSPD